MKDKHSHKGPIEGKFKNVISVYNIAKNSIFPENNLFRERFEKW